MSSSFVSAGEVEGQAHTSFGEQPMAFAEIYFGRQKEFVSDQEKRRA